MNISLKLLLYTETHVCIYLFTLSWCQNLWRNLFTKVDNRI